ncbi:hypothetical protein GN244_ATG20451 [Phytophthora infestans]|uniref:Uncharacterized protein n=1 Tax=Phytophthora infestans TaxID=4787 RepID=A0A833SJF8_PHYIN|nr:hypothetical protein GN244_ATG20451 [Phytophthora infestans]
MHSASRCRQPRHWPSAASRRWRSFSRQLESTTACSWTPSARKCRLSSVQPSRRRKWHLTHALARAKKETEAAQQHSQWLETQLSEKTKTVQELRLDLAKHTHDLEELKIRSTEELTSAKRQLESARLANKKMENALIKSKEDLKELHASKESAADASTRVTELQTLCDSLRKSLTDSEQALARETERTKEQVEHLFREQAEASETRIQALEEDLQTAEQKIQELEKKDFRYRQPVQWRSCRQLRVKLT